MVIEESIEVEVAEAESTVVESIKALAEAGAIMESLGIHQALDLEAADPVEPVILIAKPNVEHKLTVVVHLQQQRQERFQRHLVLQEVVELRQGCFRISSSVNRILASSTIDQRRPHASTC